MNSRCPKARFISSRRLPAAMTWPSSTSSLTNASSPCPVPVSAAPATSAWRSASRTRSSPAPPKASSGPAGREAFSGGKAAAVSRGTREKSTGHSLFMGARWTDSGLPEESFPRPGNQRTFQSHSPKRQRAGRGFPPFFITFQKTRGLPCVLRDISRDWKPHQNLRDGNVFPWGGLLRFPHHERSHSLDTSRSTV